MSIVDQLKIIVAEELDVNLSVEEIDEYASLYEEGLGLDSIALVELISLVEKNFDFQFADTDLTPENFTNLYILAKFIDSNKLSLIV